MRASVLQIRFFRVDIEEFEIAGVAWVLLFARSRRGNCLSIIRRGFGVDIDIMVRYRLSWAGRVILQASQIERANNHARDGGR